MLKLTQKFFSGVVKKPKMELTIRTPYATIVDKLTDFTRIISKTDEAYLNVQNNVPPVLHILPPGNVKVVTNYKNDMFSGEVIHTGGWLVVHPDNTCEITLMDCFDKKDIKADKLSQADIDKLSKENKYVERIRTNAQKSVLKHMST